MTTKLCLAQDPAADALLSDDPLALLVGMLLDQQVPMERAFAAPFLLAQRLGRATLDAGELAAYDSQALAEIFAGPPALHRFPGAMAARVQELARVIVEAYDADPTNLWSGVSDGMELRHRLESLPGFGKQKAQIFLALLGKQLGIRPRGWREAAGPYGEDGSRRSVADITGPESLAEVRTYKKQMKAAAKTRS